MYQSIRTPPDQELNKSLLAALRADDATWARSILDKQGWPSDSEWSDYKLLMKAVHLGCKRVAWLLLEKGARVFKKPRVNSPLHEVASRFGWTNFAKVLLDKGARVADVNSKGDTALHVAFAHQKSMELVDLLLKVHVRNGAQDIVNKDGLSLLHIACTRPNLTAVNALLEEGSVDVGVKVPLISSSAYAAYTPLHFAVAFGQHEVVELLLGQYCADIYEQDSNGSTPLHLAVERRDVTMIDLIMRYEYTRADCYNKFGLSHFMAACIGSDESLVEEFLRVAPYRSWTEPDTLVMSQVKHGANYPNAGYTPLHFAAEFGRLDSAKLLLQFGARCCPTTTTNATPFALACEQDHVDICILLMECCMDASVGRSAKRKRSVSDDRYVNVDGRLVDLHGKLKKASRSISVNSDESTLISSSIVSSTLNYVDEAFLASPLTLCENFQQIFEQDDASSTWQMPKVFDFYNYDVDQKENSSLECKRDHLICNHGVSNFRLDDSTGYPSINVTKNVESDFYEPLVDVNLNYSFQSCSPRPVHDCSSIYVHNDLRLTVVESLDITSAQIFASDAEDLEISCLDEQLKFDEIFEKYLKEKNSSEHDDFETRFESNSDSPIVPESSILVHEIESAEQKLQNSGCTANNDLDATLEVSSSSSESDIVEEAAKYFSFSDDWSTVAVSSVCESDSWINNVKEFICADGNCKLFARSSPEKEVEVRFVEVERFNDHPPICVENSNVNHVNV